MGAEDSHEQRVVLHDRRTKAGADGFRAAEATGPERQIAIVRYDLEGRDGQVGSGHLN